MKNLCLRPKFVHFKDKLEKIVYFSDKLGKFVYFRDKAKWLRIFSSVGGNDDVASKGNHSP